MSRTLKIACLAIGLTAFMGLAVLGFAIWVFIPLLPAGIVFLVAVMSGRWRRRPAGEDAQTKTDYRKAA